MKTTYTIAAIVMFAVILGMGALSPAMAGKNKVDLCHYSAEETILVETDVVGEFDVITIPEHWKTINISQNGNAVNAHVSNHGQEVTNPDTEEIEIESDFPIAEGDADALDACNALMKAFPEPIDEDKVEE